MGVNKFVGSRKSMYQEGTAVKFRLYNIICNKNRIVYYLPRVILIRRIIGEKAGFYDMFGKISMDKSSGKLG